MRAPTETMAMIKRDDGDDQGDARDGDGGRKEQRDCANGAKILPSREKREDFG